MKKMIKKIALILVMMLVATSVATVVSVPQEVQAAAKAKKKKPTVIRFNCSSGTYATISRGGTTWSKGATLKPGTYTVKCSFRNYCSKEIHKTISQLRGQAWVPGTIKKGQTASMFLGFTAKNADSKQYILSLKAKDNLKLSYVSGSAKFTNNGNVKGRKLSTDLFKWGKGVQLSKSVPGNKKCSGYFTFKMKVSKASSSSKKPSKKPTKKPSKSDW